MNKLWLIPSAGISLAQLQADESVYHKTLQSYWNVWNAPNADSHLRVWQVGKLWPGNRRFEGIVESSFQLARHLGWIIPLRPVLSGNKLLN